MELESYSMPEENREIIAETIKSSMHNGPVLSNLGFIAASSFLPETSEYSRMLRRFQPTRLSGATPQGRNRAERRRKKRKGGF